MVSEPEQRHLHSGKSSRGLLNPERILRDIGLKKGDTFLDVGCGEGHFSIAASESVGNEGTIYAVDIDEEAIATLKKEIGKKNISNIEALTADITKNIPLGSGSIDVCLMVNVLHGFVANKEVESSLREITRVLNAGGILAVVDFKKISNTPGPPLSIRITPEEVEAIITRYNYKKKQTIGASPSHYAVVFSKG